MDKMKLEAYLGIPMPSIEVFEKPDQKDKCRTVLYAALDDLCACSNKLEFRLGRSLVRPEIRLLDEQQREQISRDRLFPKKHLKECEVMLVAAAIPKSAYDDLPQSGDDADGSSVRRFVARVEYCKRVSDLLVFANIARVGAIELRHSVVVQDDGVLDFSEVPVMEAYSLQQAAKVAAQMGWPCLAELDIYAVWGWATKYLHEIDGFGGTPMSRAVAAFSRLFEHKTTDEPMRLLWSLVGLEALYVTGKSEIAQQVREKAQAFLGPQSAFKKKLTRMYDFRPRFVHGDLDFPDLCLFGDARDAVSRYDDELLEATAVAVAVLVGTIQEVIRRDWAGLRFQYSVSNAPNVSPGPSVAAGPGGF
jgi:hypothetical protein